MAKSLLEYLSLPHNVEQLFNGVPNRKMINNRPIVVIGDIHGLTRWAEVVKQHEGSCFVFLGDYCDPYEKMDSDGLLDNFKAIIQLKREHPDDVMLLLGNHDMHYLTDDIPHSTRYDTEIAPIMKHILERNRELFLYAWQYGNILFTHAGISDQWFHRDFKGDDGGEHSIAEQLNNSTPEQFKAMCQVGIWRGGKDMFGGIFWADIYDTERKPLKGYAQFVGHNRVDKIKQIKLKGDTSITYCDCLHNDQFVVIRETPDTIPSYSITLEHL